MSDINDTSMKDGDVPFEPERLLRDLKSMPKISAPMDFSKHLSEAVSRLDEEAALPWWKRFFRPAAEGGFRIPALAYGSAAVMVVMIVSVYVVSVTDFQKEIQQELASPQPATESAAPTEDFLDEDGTQNPIGSEQNEPASFLSREAIPPASDADAIEMKKEKAGQPISPAPKSASGEGQSAKPERQTGRSNSVPQPPAEPQSKASDQFEFRTRGLLYEEEISEQDSAAADSLRRSDSLRRLKLNNPAKQLSDPK